MTQTAIYEDRLVLYADILGWKAAIGSHDPETLLDVVHELHHPADNHNARARIDLQERRVVETDVGVFPVKWINPLYLQVQFGAFSDNFVYSMPASFGGRILGVASRMARVLLRRGFLTRGAIVLGQLHHVDNVVFGPALNEAVRLEQDEAFYPRILVAAAAAEHIERVSYDARSHAMIWDHTGRRVVNPFELPLIGPEEVALSVLRENYYPGDVDALVAAQIVELAGGGRHKDAEKWQYMRRLIDGPIKGASPLLRRAWDSE